MSMEKNCEHNERKNKPSAPGFGDEAGRGVLCGQAANGQSGLSLVSLVRPFAGQP